MLTTKTRKVGNSVIVSIPKPLNVELNTEYVIYKSQNGSLIFTPKIKNPFTSDQHYEADKTNDCKHKL
jgi:antitoxin component of MazEF toxin-antitoxin module